jgi:hypothetical protein
MGWQLIKAGQTLKPSLNSTLQPSEDQLSLLLSDDLVALLKRANVTVANKTLKPALINKCLEHWSDIVEGNEADVQASSTVKVSRTPLLKKCFALGIDETEYIDPKTGKKKTKSLEKSNISELMQAIEAKEKSISIDLEENDAVTSESAEPSTSTNIQVVDTEAPRTSKTKKKLSKEVSHTMPPPMDFKELLENPPWHRHVGSPTSSEENVRLQKIVDDGKAQEQEVSTVDESSGRDGESTVDESYILTLEHETSFELPVVEGMSDIIDLDKSFVTVFCKGLDGKTIPIMLKKTDSIMTYKRLLHLYTGIPIHDMRLSLQDTCSTMTAH